jgi:hypothetical protein
MSSHLQMWPYGGHSSDTERAVFIRKTDTLTLFMDSVIKQSLFHIRDRLCDLVVRVLGYRSGGPGSIPGTTRNKNSGSGMGSTQPREYNWGATW